MSFFAIQNFRYGLDARRSEYTSQPGTLLTLDNCHINEGGEIEKRAAFVQTTGIANTFGLVAGNNTLYVFGSAAAPGGLPAGVTYVQCISPQGGSMSKFIFGTLFNGLPWIVATYINDGPGNPTRTYAFYNGTVVFDLIAGEILNGAAGSNSVIADFFAGQNFPVANYTSVWNIATATANVTNTPGSNYIPTIVKSSAAGTLVAAEVSANTPSVSAGAAVGSFSIMSGTASPGTNLIGSVKVNTVEVLGANVNWVTDNAHTAIAVCAQIITWCNAHALAYTASANGNQVNIYTVGGTPGSSNGFVVQATSAGNVCIGDCIISFSLTGAVPTDIVTSFIIGSGADLGAIAWNTNLQTSVQAIATALIATGNYTAWASGSALRISKTTVTSSDTPQAVNIVPGTNIAIAAGTSTTLAAVVSPNIAVLTANSPPAGAPLGLFATTAYNTCLASGGVPPYTYQWNIVSVSQVNNSGSVFTPTLGVAPKATTQSVYFFLPSSFNLNVPITANAVCTVTDSTGTIVSSNLIGIIYTP